MENGPRFLTESDLSVLTTSKQTQFGAVGATGDGRRFRYVSFGGTSTIAPGQLMTASATTAAYQGLAISATGGSGGQVAANLTTNATQIVVTNGATSITADQFAEGYLEVLVGSNGTSGAYLYRVKGNTAAGNAAQFTVFLAEPLRNTTALVPGTDTVNLNVSVYSGVVASATAAVAVGFTILPVPNTATVTNYGWVQTHGVVDVLNDAAGTITVGGGFAQSATVAGSVVASTASTAPIIGITRKAISASTVGPAYVKID
jgi:hypothetical protein